MYQVIIADDEKKIRTGLREIVDWNKLGFEVSQVFADGEEVLAYLEYIMPDVILTDIKMANVSGIEVARYVSEHKMPCRIILLSGFHEFELAVDAVRCGVENYLLKPVDLTELKDVFSKLRKKLDEEKAVREVSNQERENMEEMRKILEMQFLEEWMLGAAKEREYIDSRFRIIYPQLDAGNTGCFVFDVEIEDFDHFIRNIWEYSYDQFEENFKNFLQIYEGNYLFRMIYKKENALRLLAIQCDGQEARLQEKELKVYVDALLEEMKTLFQIRTQYVIRKIYEDMYVTGRTGEVFTKEDALSDETQMEEQIHLMFSNVLTGEYRRARQLCHSILDRMEEYTAARRNREIYGILSALVQAVSGTNEHLARMLEHYLKENSILELDSETAVRDYCDRIFDYIRAEESEEGYHVDSLVRKARKYISDNIYRDVSREEVARKMYICPSYLSKLFVRETGETYLTYVNRIKMDKAIELLKNPENKSYQIGEKLGYSTPKYFVRLFKAHTGMSPNEYRRKVLSVLEAGSAQ